MAAVVDVPLSGGGPDDRPLRRRTFGIVVLAGIHLLLAALAAMALVGIREFQPGSGGALLLEALGDLAPVASVISIIGVAIAVGLWRLDRWSWYAAMLWTGIGLAWQILLYLRADPNYLYMVVYVVEAFYLNQRDVKRTFQATSRVRTVVLLEEDGSGPA